jgi:hypothetical protein
MTGFHRRPVASDRFPRREPALRPVPRAGSSDGGPGGATRWFLWRALHRSRRAT